MGSKTKIKKHRRAAAVMSIRPAAPEDLRKGQYITVGRTLYELVPFPCDPGLSNDVEPLRIRVMPYDSGHPMRVVSVCLPFVLVQYPKGGHRTLDTRQHHIVRLPRRFGETAFQRLKKGVASIF